MGDVIKSIANKTNEGEGQRNPAKVVWDLPTRLFHWILVLLVALAWMTSEYFEELGDPRLQWHRWNGCAVLTVLVWRGLWGIWGPPCARFTNFLKGPQDVYQYIKDLFSGKSRHFLGHNPLGGLMIVALLATVTTICLLGLFSIEENDLAAGPLAHFVSEKLRKLATKWHGLIFDSLLIELISIHIVANSLYGIFKKEPLITAMFTGTKPFGEYEDETVIGPQKDFTRRAIIFLGLAIVNVLMIFLLLGR